MSRESTFTFEQSSNVKADYSMFSTNSQFSTTSHSFVLSRLPDGSFPGHFFYPVVIITLYLLVSRCYLLVSRCYFFSSTSTTSTTSATSAPRRSLGGLWRVCRGLPSGKESSSQLSTSRLRLEVESRFLLLLQNKWLDMRNCWSFTSTYWEDPLGSGRIP